MTRLPRLLLAVALGGSLLIGPAAAANHYTYSASKFGEAQATGKPILVDISASWCPVCKAQNSVIERELAKPEFARYVVFSVDFDSQKDVVRAFNAPMQSTLIVFKGKNEKTRLVGVTDPNIIDAMMRRAAD
ncbi:MAG: thioredoxin family protein [Alphaproteobacteria bacterium]|nr:thioredoxin family protein [Alphaproteobacteria bacterium]